MNATPSREIDPTVFVHADPASVGAVDRAGWPAFWRETLDSPEMRYYVDAVRFEGASVRASVLSDLCAYHGCSEEDAIDTAINWGKGALAEWQASTGTADYHRRTTASTYSLLWYAYLQAAGIYPAVGAGVARSIGSAGTDYLDFGSGVGVTSQVFHRLGYRVTLADVSTNLLDFARFRLTRRGTDAKYIDLGTERLDVDKYDVITAIDVLAHVPDLESTLADLHHALRPGGLFYANVVTRPAANGAPWHVHAGDLRPRRIIHSAGFQPVRHLDHNAGIVYRKTDPGSPLHVARVARDAILLGPPRAIYRGLASRARSLAR